MAKDDYFVLVYKILKYLYKCLTSGAAPDFNYLTFETKDFPIHKEYWEYILEKMVDEEFIEGVYVLRSDTGFTSIKYTSNTRITPLGIEYLEDNKMMKKPPMLLKILLPLYLNKNGLSCCHIQRRNPVFFITFDLFVFTCYTIFTVWAVASPPFLLSL